MTGESGHIVKRAILSVKPTPDLSFHKKKNCQVPTVSVERLIKIHLSSWRDVDPSAVAAAFPVLYGIIQDVCGSGGTKVGDLRLT